MAERKTIAISNNPFKGLKPSPTDASQLSFNIAISNNPFKGLKHSERHTRREHNQLQFQIIPLRDFRLYKYTVDNQHLKVALYNGSKFIGCVGQVSYKIMGEVEPEIIKQVNAIADFALYAGVGRKTPMGMGMVRRQTN